MNAQAVIDHIVSWLTDFLDKSGADGFVVGVSGGIDSAVTSGLVARTGHPVLCVEMPIHQAESQVSRARKHIEMLESQFHTVSSVWTELTPFFDSFVAAMPAVENEEKRFHALANTRARMRMTTLYYFAALHNYLVAGTGNKVEDFGVGFYTKYGDGGVDLSPIADLMKSEVYMLADAMQVIPEIQNAVPTDGLWGDDRSDEDQIGASYPELEWAMEFNPDSFEGQLSERQHEVLAIYKKYNQANQHKMHPIPVCEIPETVKNR
jgi:NAD+ synthase